MPSRSYYLAGGSAPAPQRRAARAILNRVCPALEIEPRLRWILPSVHAETMHRLKGRFIAPDGGRASLTRERSVLGLASPNGEINIRADIAPRRVAFTAAHEARHVWQFGHGWDMTDAPRIEADANAYARAALRHHAGTLRAVLPATGHAPRLNARAALRAA